MAEDLYLCTNNISMRAKTEVVLLPEEAANEARIKELSLAALNLSKSEPAAIQVLKRSIDARAKQVKIRLEVEVCINESLSPLLQYQAEYPNVSGKEAVLIVGAGPAGLFAAIRLLELGIKPIVIERGKDVQQRRRDLAALSKDHIVNPDSNYCFGEGGAGTYSDGKLYTRSSKRGDVRKILETLVCHGASEEILIDAHPHIGTNKLPKVVQALRESIVKAGGEVHFNQRVVDFIVKNNELTGVKTADGSLFEGKALILATGHSSRDIFSLLQEKKILIEPKPFALGLRVEHPQAIIDKVQYHCDVRGDFLPASSYSLNFQAHVRGNQKKGVYSFCMCPGGFIVPSATSPGEIVVNGMSPSRRDSKYANSGIVVEVNENDWRDYNSKKELAALQYQSLIEKRAFEMGSKTQAAPAQRLTDFVMGKVSSSLPDCSYVPGLHSMDLSLILPQPISNALKQGFMAFGKKMKGYFTEEAVLVGVESRTSSPVRIPRDKESLEHPQLKRLYPCGEGAGYAGGIVSAAIDGQRCADALVESYLK